MDLIKQYIYYADPKIKAMLEVIMYSQKWIQWIAHFSPAICSYCLKHHGKILAIDDPTIIWPEWYVTKEEARAQGWISFLGNLGDVLPGMTIGGNIYHNWDGRLPQQPGRIWYEADFDYSGGFRNGKRILYSNDGLLFVTFDHYLTFSEIISGEAP